MTKSMKLNKMCCRNFNTWNVMINFDIKKHFIDCVYAYNLSFNFCMTFLLVWSDSFFLTYVSVCLCVQVQLCVFVSITLNLNSNLNIVLHPCSCPVWSPKTLLLCLKSPLERPDLNTVDSTATLQTVITDWLMSHTHTVHTHLQLLAF